MFIFISQANLIRTAAINYLLDGGVQWRAAPAVKSVRDAAVELLHTLVEFDDESVKARDEKRSYGCYGRAHGKQDEQNDPQILTQASHLKKLPLESLSVDIGVYILRSVELLDQFLEEISRILKPGGTIVIQQPQPATLSTDKASSTFERKLLLAGYLELHVLDMKTLRPVNPRGRLGHPFP